MTFLDAFIVIQIAFSVLMLLALHHYRDEYAEWAAFAAEQKRRKRDKR
jgi:hypothetical protein